MNPDGLFVSLWNTFSSFVNSGVDNFIVPAGILILAIIALVKLIQAAADHQNGHGDDLFVRLKPSLICIIIIAILLTKDRWWGYLVGVFTE